MENKSLSDEKELLLLMSQDHEHAFKKIYQCYGKRLYGKLLKLLKSKSSADELLQNVFIKVWVNRKNIDAEKSFRSYLFRIAENEVYDFYRKTARNKKLQKQLIKASTQGYSHIEEHLQSKELLSKIAEVIDLMPLQRREIFRLCKIDDKSYEEVSLRLGISVSTISGHIVKANQFMRKHFIQRLAI